MKRNDEGLKSLKCMVIKGKCERKEKKIGTFAWVARGGGERGLVKGGVPEFVKVANTTKGTAPGKMLKN